MKIINPTVSGSLIVSGSARISGQVSASSFVGDGSGLSGVTSYTNTDTLNYINSLGIISGSSQLTNLGNITLSGSIIPALDNTYDLGSPSKTWRDVYISSGSLYIDGTKVLSSTTDTLTITTDVGQSIKILEGGADDITLQTDTGNIELKGTVELLSGKKILDSAGTQVIIGDNLNVEGNISLNGTVDGIDLQTFSGSVDSRIKGISTNFNDITNKPTLLSSSAQLSNSTIPGNLTVSGILTAQEFHTEFISASIIYRSGSTKFGDSLDDIHNFSGSLAVNTDNLFVSGGRVGIGTINPIEKLDVNGNIRVVANNGYIAFKSSGASGLPKIGMDSFAAFSFVNTAGDTNLYISNGGNVGIGTTSPSRLLHLSSSNDVYIRVDRGSLQSLFGTDNVGAYIGMQSDAPIRLVTNTNERMRITSNGNVGIGTTSPLSKLTINTSGSSVFLMERGDNKFGFEIGTNIIGMYDYTNTEFRWRTIGSNVLLAESSGNVGIGTTSPSKKLHVNVSDDDRISINQSTNNLNFGLNFSFQDVRTWDIFNLGTSNSPLFFYSQTLGAVAVSFFQDNVGIGIGSNTPSYKLHVNGSVAGVGAYNNLSDINWKKNVNDLSYGLDKLLQLRPITFNWLNEQYGDRLNTGFIAQEVEDILPDMVTTADDGVKSLATTDLIPLLVKSIQELKAEIDELRSEINLLKNQ